MKERMESRESGGVEKVDEGREMEKEDEKKEGEWRCWGVGEDE